MIKIKNLNKCFGEYCVFDNFNLELSEKKINCLFGPSGIGKTALSRIISGLDDDYKGSVKIEGHSKISYVFQETRLLNWLTVYDNLNIILENEYSLNDRKKCIEKYLKLVNLWDFRDYKISALSGGMAQRVSLARAFAYPADLLIMDEPFKGLDMVLCEELQNSFKSLWESDLRTVIFITHDLHEAIELSDEIFILTGHPAKIVERIAKKDFNKITREKIKELLVN